MILQKRNSLMWLLILFLITVVSLLGFRAYKRSQIHPRLPDHSGVGPSISNGTPDPLKNKLLPPGTPPPKKQGAEFSETRELRLSDDSDNKRADFWLEQPLDFTDAGAAAVAAKKDLLDLFVAFDTKTSMGPRIHLKGCEISLDVPKAAPVSPVTLSEISKGEHVLGALWRRGELSVWFDSRLVLSWTPAEKSSDFLRGPSAAQVRIEGVRLGARRAIALNEIQFDDNFMRDSANDSWRPLFGQWELTAMTFPERSANPFSLRAAFKAEKASEDALFAGRQHEHDYGIGVILSPYEGTLHITRITGGSPAQKAGLAEDDIFLEIDGYPLDQINLWDSYRIAYQLLMRGYSGDVRLKVLRPGEKQVRDFTIKRDYYKWGTPVNGIPISPVNPAQQLGSDEVSMIVTGEPGWSDYAAEVAVKPLGAGGMGLAVAWLSPDDYVLFRWRGPLERSSSRMDQDGKRLSADRMELVRVAGGKETILAERNAGYRPYEFYRMGIDWSGDKISCLIDGNEVMKATISDLKRGQVALYALKGEPVFFDDVHISSNRDALNAAHNPERKLNSIFVFEDDMEVWANPALEWQRSVDTGWAVHQARFTGDQAILLNKPHFDDLTVAVFCGDNPAENGGEIRIKDGKATISGKCWKEAETDVGAGPFDRIAIRATKSGLEADIGGIKLKADALKTDEMKTLISSFGMNPKDRVAIHGLKNLGDPAVARVTSSNLLEYTFDTSPTDWKVESGRWGLLNKWICDPRWSWFGGRTKTLASLWNKYEFKGDLSVEAHVALMMQKEDPPYERPGDYNIAICGDGVNLDSGYTLIFGGDNNSWTRLYRKGKMVAESLKEDHRIFSDRIRHPDKPELHQRWFHLKLEKIGNTLAFYRDNMLAFTYVDPEPLPDGRLAFWTLDNGFLLSRVRIAHGGLKPAQFEPRRSNLYEDSRVINMFDGEVLTAVEPEELPAPIQGALAAPKDGFHPADAPPLVAPKAAGVATEAAPVPKLNPGQSARAWRVVNGTGGGPMALQWKSAYVDPENGILRFAYRIDPGANVDVYLIDQSGRDQAAGFNPRQNGAYRWRLTGPKESNEFTPMVGEIPGVVADGKWHAIQFDINATWRAFWRERGFNKPGRRPYRLLVGNLDNGDYLLAGMNGNHAGASFSISDFSVLAPRDVDNKPPKVERVIWPFDDEGDGHTISVVFNDFAGSGILEESLQVTLNDVAVGRDMQDFDFNKQRLNIDLIKLGFPMLVKGQQIKLNLLGFQDRAHNSQEGYNEVFTFDPEVAKNAAKPVLAPQVAIKVAGIDEPVTVPLSLSQVAPAGPGSVARLQDSADAPPWALRGEKHSLQIVSPSDGTSFGFQYNNMAYEMRHFPYLELEYKSPPEMPFNLHFNDRAGTLHALLLTDIGDARDPYSQNISSRCGPPADFVADGTWHRTVVPLQRMFRTAFAAPLPGRRPDTRVWEIENADPQPAVIAMGVYDNGWRGNRRGMQYWFHKITPVATGTLADFSFSWQAADLCGIEDYASCVDGVADTDPNEKKEIASGESLETAIKRRGVPLKDGWNFIHVKVKNRAGQWSEPVHRRFCLDTSAPKVIRTEPQNGAAFAGQSIKLFLEEEHGVELPSLRMIVNGETVNTTLPGLTYNPVENSITFDASKCGMSWPNGRTIEVSVEMLRDSLGNGNLMPFTFSFKADRHSDEKGPEIAHMRWISPQYEGRQQREMEMETSFTLDFEEHLGHVHALRDCQQEWIDDPAQACFGRRALKFTALENDSDAQIMLHKNSWHMDSLPVMQFDYKTSPGFAVDILVEAMGEWMSIRFTGSGAAPEGGRKIGKVEEVVADGTWHHASVDLRALIEAARPELKIRIINKVMFSAQGRPGCKRGATFFLDNLEFSPAQGTGGRFEWDVAPDPSGIAGYSFVADQDPATVPPDNVNQTLPNFGIGNQPGVIYAHVKARDQAGNWGPVRTMRVDTGR